MGVDYFEKVIISEDPLVKDDYIIILAIFSGINMLKWIVMDSHKHSFQNVIYYQEQFYTVNMAGALFAVEIDPHPKLIETTPCLKRHTCTCNRYLVELAWWVIACEEANDDEPYADNDDWNWNGSPTGYNDTVIFPDVDDVDIGIFREGEDSNIGATHDEGLERTIYRSCIFKIYKLVCMNNCEYKWKKGDWSCMIDCPN